jgi:signal transduction histidine kinase
VVVERVVDAVRIAVSDAGPGVAPEDREAVFDRFSRGRSAPSRGTSPGVGLGLALVRDHVLAHGGACWYEDAAGGGACFVVEVPAAAGSPEEPAATHAATDAATAPAAKPAAKGVRP